MIIVHKTFNKCQIVTIISWTILIETTKIELDKKVDHK
jgi:hypothetical protein